MTIVPSVANIDAKQLGQGKVEKPWVFKALLTSSWGTALIKRKKKTIANEENSSAQFETNRVVWDCTLCQTRRKLANLFLTSSGTS